MRKFLSYGPLNTKLHYYAPRTALLGQVLNNLVGDPTYGEGHYITIWAPRQSGKSWIVKEVIHRLKQGASANEFAVVTLSLDALRTTSDPLAVMQIIQQKIAKAYNIPEVTIQSTQQFQESFAKERLTKPLILLLDEFDVLAEAIISEVVAVFRGIHLARQYQDDLPSDQRDYQLHAVALIGVRSVLGIENQRGSPFNIQHSIHIANLTFDEVAEMFRWYSQESGQTIEPEVITRLYAETQGQPGLTCWLGELLTETYNEGEATITLSDFERAYSAAINRLPNVNILNIISKAKQEPYRHVILELFRTAQKLAFRFDDPEINFLYMHGVVDAAIEPDGREYVKFANPLIQKRLFNYFAYELYDSLERLTDPFDDLRDTLSATGITIATLVRRYEQYLKLNRQWLLKDAPRRQSDLRIYEAVYHFNFYRYLSLFLENHGGRVYPEFPTGNGKIDLLITYQTAQQQTIRYGIEVKSFTSLSEYPQYLQQAANYGQKLGLAEIALVFFIEAIDDANRQKYETVYQDPTTGVRVTPFFVTLTE